MVFVIFGPKTRSRRVGRCLEGVLEVGRFVVTEYGVVGSHRDPIQYLEHVFFRLGAMWLEGHFLLVSSCLRPSRHRAEEQ